MDVVTFASPSTVKGWVANVGVHRDLPVACIGVTSGDAAREAGFTQVFYAPQPGIDGWVDSIERAVTCFAK